jgi:uncharacterized membrane protein YdfJ with MMPL/SSD domain
MPSLARWCFRRRWLVLAGWVLALVLLTAVSDDRECSQRHRRGSVTKRHEASRCASRCDLPART